MSVRFCPPDALLYRSIRAVSCCPGTDWALCEISVPDSAEDANAFSIWLVSLDGEGTEQFTSGDDNRSAAWVPDAASIAFVTSRPGSTWSSLPQRSPTT